MTAHFGSAATRESSERLQIVANVAAALERAPAPFAVRFLLAYLGAITIIGKGPTYIGYPPVFWGEVAMLVILVWVVRHVGVSQILFSGPTLVTNLVLAFLTVGALLTAKSVPVWGLDAIRDAAIWYYGLLFFVGLNLTRWEVLGDKIWKAVTIFWLLALVWGTADLLSGSRLSSLGPEIPWRKVTVLSNTGSETGQNVALGACIVMSSYLCPVRLAGPVRALMASVALAAFAASYGRGQKVGFALAVSAAVVATFGHGRMSGFPGRLSSIIAVGVIAGVLLATLTTLPIASKMQLDRFLEADPTVQEGTHYWRLIWWKNLKARVMSTNPAFGLGFGQNLSVYNPYLGELDSEKWPVRSPHNFNVTVFARMGIAGLTLWVAILVAGIGRLLLLVWRGRNGRTVYLPPRREELVFWAMMLIATWGNASFGVLMEGPVLGVWFWFALGFATGRSLTSGNLQAINASRVTAHAGLSR